MKNKLLLLLLIFLVPFNVMAEEYDNEDSVEVVENEGESQESSCQAGITYTTVNDKMVPTHGIKSLSIDGVDFNFNYETCDYNIDYNGDLDKLDFKYTTFSDSDVVEISDSTLKEGKNNIVVLCKNEGLLLKYNITVNKNSKKDAFNNNIMIIILSAIGVVVIGIISFILIKKRNKKQ